MDDFELELKQDFLVEAQQGLEEAEQYFLALESDPENIETLNQIFRLAHNLKGTARAVGFGEIAEFTHKMENLILQLKEQKITANSNIVEILLHCNDCVKDMIGQLTQNLDATFDTQDLENRIQQAIDGSGQEEPAAVAEEPVFEEPVVEAVAEVPDASAFEEEPVVEAVAETPEEPAIVPGQELNPDDFESTSDYVEAIQKLHAAQQAPPVEEVKPQAVEPPKAATPPPAAKKEAAKVDETIRVSIPRIEKLNNIVGELVILQSVLQQSKKSQDMDSMSKSLGQLEKLTKEIHEMSMSLRMIPVKPTMMKLQRIVRDTSKNLSKEVELTLSGENTEVDKTIIEHLNEPLVHIVRNAIDHGLETPDEREEAGKPRQGSVNISCFHEGNNIVISIKDDGKGIHPDVIRSKAIEKGVISADSKMSDADVIQLIFHAGFSTKAVVSETSGRGVGMDVVKTNILRLNGHVNVESKVGEGSEFKILLPLTTAVIEGMIAVVDNRRFVLAIDQIQETLSIEEGSVSKNAATGEVFNLRGETIPLIRSRKLLNIKSKAEDSSKEKIAVITKKEGLTFAMTVDDILAQQQIVIKKLGQEVKTKNNFMGSSILGDGMPSLIIDLHGIAESAANSQRRAS